MKNKIAFIIICSVFVVVFNISFFLLKGNEVYAATWISYGFIHLAYIGVLITRFLDEKHEAADLVLSSYLVSIVYFVVEFIIGIVFIIVNPIGFKVALIIQMVLLGSYLILLLSNVITNSKISDSLETAKYDRDYIKGVSSVIEAVKLTLNDEQAMKLLNCLYDVIHSSQMKSSRSAMIIETEIEERIKKLERNISAMSVEEQRSELKSLIDLANKRNIVVKRSD